MRAFAITFVVTAACSSPGTSTAIDAPVANTDGGDDLDAPAGTPVLPPRNGSLDYQLGGAYPPPAGVQIVSRDRTEAPAAGLYNICYVNGFQVQPGEAKAWLRDHPDLVLRDGNGDPVIDPDWNELLIDVGTEAKRNAVVAIVGGWIADCERDGYDAIEIDNLDSYTRSGGLLDEDDAVAAMALFSAAGHRRGLAVAQKNSAELVPRQAELATDFVVAEECNRFNECGDYTAAYGEHVLVIEYGRTDYNNGCRDFPQLSIVLRDRDLVPDGATGYVYAGC